TGAIAGVPAAAPSVQRNSQAALDHAGGFVAARMPLLLPLNELGGLLQLGGVNLRQLSGHADVLEEHLHWIDAQPGGQVFERRHGDQAKLRVVWRTPSACRADVGRSEEHTSELQSREKLVCRLL